MKLSKPVLLLIITLVLIIIFVVVVFFSLVYKKDPLQSFEGAEIKTYQQVEIGKTPDQVIKNLQGFKKEESFSNGESKYSFSSPVSNRDNIVITKNGVAVFKSAVSVEKTGWLHPSISEYKNLYGNPEAVYTGSRTFGEKAKTNVYASKGVAVIFNPFNNEVYEVQNFQPTTADEYLKNWGDDVEMEQEKVPEDEAI